MRRLLLAMLTAALIPIAFAPAAEAATTITPSISLVAASKLTYDNQSTTMTGTVTYQASNGTVTPLANQPVQISCYLACNGFSTTTDSNGHFTVPVTATWWEMSVTASISQTSTVAAAATTVWLYPNSPTRILATATPSVLSSPSQPVTFSGTLQYQGDNGTWKPLPARTVTINGAGANTTVTTASDGTFSTQATVSESTSSTAQQVSVEWSPWIDDNTTVDETFFNYALTNVTITNLATVAFTNFKASVSATGSLTVRGAISVTPSTPVTVQYQYSANGTSGWRTLGSAQTVSGFSNSYPAPLASAFYRAVVVAGSDYLGATSAVVKAGRTVTRIIRFAVSATRVKVGHSFRISGTLQQYVHGAWRALTKQKVWILLRPKGSSTWYWWSKPVTNAKGQFSAVIRVPRGLPTSRWLPVFEGASGYYACAPAKAIWVTITR